MVLAVDIGNSYIKFAVFDETDAVRSFFSISSYPLRSADEYRLLIKQFLCEDDTDISLECAVISSVVPSITLPISNAVSRLTGKRPFIIGAGTHTGFRIKINESSELGADIVSNVAAARTLYSNPIVIIDAGTATTLTAVDSNGDVIGTIIHPGIKICSDVLSRSAAQLTDVVLSYNNKLIGQNSTESIQSGLINGHSSMIDGLISKIRAQLCTDGTSLSIVATGDYAELVIPYCSEKIDIVGDLTMRGSIILYRMNKRK